MLSLAFAAIAFATLPAENPDRTLRYSGVDYDVYVLEKGDTYSVKICARYKLTGTRFKRNTCRHSSAQEPVRIRAIGIEDLLELSPQLLFERRARAAEKVANKLINTNASVELFWAKVSQAIMRRP